MKLTILALCLVSLLPPDRYTRARHYIDLHRAALGLDEKNQLRRSRETPRDPRIIRFDQYYRGVRVRDSWLDILPVDREHMMVSDHRAKNVDVDATPQINGGQATLLAVRDPDRIVTGDPVLMIIPPGSIEKELPNRYRLTWIVPVRMGVEYAMYIDAHCGDVYYVERLTPPA